MKIILFFDVDSFVLARCKWPCHQQKDKLKRSKAGNLHQMVKGVVFQCSHRWWCGASECGSSAGAEIQLTRYLLGQSFSVCQVQVKEERIEVDLNKVSAKQARKLEIPKPSENVRTCQKIQQTYNKIRKIQILC